MNLKEVFDDDWSDADADQPTYSSSHQRQQQMQRYDSKGELKLILLLEDI